MKKIRNRIFLQLLIPILAVYVVVILGGIQYMGVSFRETSLFRKQAALTNIVRGIDDWLLSRITEVVQLSRIPLFQTGDEAAIRKYLVSWRKRLGFHYSDVYLIESDGSYWRSDHTTGFLEDTNYPALFFEEQSLLKYAGPHRFGSILKKHFVIGLPIYDENDTVSRVLTVTIKLSTLRRVFGYFAFDEFDSWMVVNPFSIIITHANPEMSGLSERGEYGKTFLINESWKDRQIFVQIMRNGWKVVAFIETNKLMDPYRQAYALIGSFTIFLIAIVVGFVLILSSMITQPILKLNRGVHNIMAGDYSQEIESETNDELSELADSFNRLSKRMLTLRTEDRFAFLGHIAARMAHEMRKPLHLIQLSAQALQGKPKDEKRYLTIIGQEIENADHFIGEILNFAHNESLDKEYYHLPDLLKMVVEKYRIIADKKRITITVTELKNIPGIYVDVIRMEEVFSNLLQNAIDSITEAPVKNPKKEISVTIEFNTEQEIQITFIDSGQGFDDTVIDKLFDPYFTTREKGTGLGLSLCYRIVMAHGGRIVLNNTKEGQAKVEVIFPV